MKRRRRRSETGATGNGTEMGAADEDDILARNFGQMSPYVCREALLARFEKLVNQLASGWKYHISNTEGIKQAWLQFEDFYSNVCSYTSG
ncbi:hypothetical protein QR680_001181 [Steinernema hermaphroditum]|uniref:Uncharacterized protein n=1 Tax=Steinernema hermaphroditum TaxID=289476 RepID=A0AA39LEY7_9BILA|nr:hypothetical protein QR680_001181 [Steinernema hermaphroditum]